jgi:hypothetical protein
MNTTFDLVAYTQVRENYATHDWNGVGPAPQGWKCKGGNNVVVRSGITAAEAVVLSNEEMDALVDAAEIGEDNDYFQEFVVGFGLVEISAETVRQAAAKLAEENYRLEWLDTPFGRSEAGYMLDYYGFAKGVVEPAIAMVLSGDVAKAVHESKKAERGLLDEAFIDALDLLHDLGVRA